MQGLHCYYIIKCNKHSLVWFGYITPIYLGKKKLFSTRDIRQCLSIVKYYFIINTITIKRFLIACLVHVSINFAPGYHKGRIRGMKNETEQLTTK